MQPMSVFHIRQDTITQGQTHPLLRELLLNTLEGVAFLVKEDAATSGLWFAARHLREF